MSSSSSPSSLPDSSHAHTHPHPISTPLTFPCGRTVPHRLCKAALSEGLCDARTNRPGSQHVRLYQRWADGGVAMCITGNVMIDRRYMEAPYNVALEAADGYDLRPYVDWARAIKSKGALAIMQINHPGRQCPFSVNKEPIGPSAVPLRAFGLPPWMSPTYLARAMTGDEIDDVISRYVKTAELAIRAGFDGIELHAAHGYLISQFLSPIANIRTDEWGGSDINRQRLLLKILQTLRKTLPSNTIIGVKLNSSDYQNGGQTRNTGFTNEQSMEVIREIEKCQIDFIEISGGTYENAVMFSRPSRTSTREREAFFMEFAQQARKQFPNIKFMLTGGFRSRSAMNHVIESGDVDLIGLGRPLAVQPDLPNYLLSSSEPDSLVRCRDYDITLNVGHPRVNDVLNTALQGVWHMSQLSRMSYGSDPDIHISRIGVMFSQMGSQMFPIQRIINTSFIHGFITAITLVFIAGVAFTYIYR